MQEKSMSQTGGWYVELEVWMRKSVRLRYEHMDITAGKGKVIGIMVHT